MYHFGITEGEKNQRQQLADRVHQLRVQCALTQLELAAGAGVGRATIARIEGGAVVPHLSTVRSLAATLGVVPGDITAGLEHLWAAEVSD